MIGTALASGENLTLPAAACDCHVHVIGPQAKYPMSAQRPYTPGPSPVEALCEHLTRLGLQRVVIVQPSVYGTDNRCMLDSLDRLDGIGRGVAVLEDDISMTAMRALHARGVRGVRVNLESIGACDVPTARALLALWAGRVAVLGWHVQLYAAPRMIDALAEDLAALPAPVVLDHFALVSSFPEYVGGEPAGVLADLLRTGGIHVKLSAPYRLNAPDLALAWARAFLHVAPAAVLWGSDWPHTAREPRRDAHEVSAYRLVETTELEGTLQRWLPTSTLLRQVLTENPARLYGF